MTQKSEGAVGVILGIMYIALGKLVKVGKGIRCQ